MKIKTKKQLNLPRLIEWAWENDVKDEIFTCEYGSREVYFDSLSRFVSENYISDDTTFTVEVEEEITEDTEIKHLVYIADDNDIEVLSNFTIREVKGNDIKEFHAYVDGGFKLIWTKENGLVE